MRVLSKLFIGIVFFFCLTVKANAAPADFTPCDFYVTDTIVLHGMFLSGSCQPFRVPTQSNDQSGASVGDIGCNGCTAAQVDIWINSARQSGNNDKKAMTDCGTHSPYTPHCITALYLNTNDAHIGDPIPVPATGPPTFNVVGCISGMTSEALKSTINVEALIAADPNDTAFLHLLVANGGHIPATTADRFWSTSGNSEQCNALVGTSSSTTLTSGAKAPLPVTSTANIFVGEVFNVTGETSNFVGSFIPNTSITPLNNWSATLGPQTFAFSVLNTPPLLFFNMASPIVIANFNSIVNGTCTNPVSGLWAGLGVNCPADWGTNIQKFLDDQCHPFFGADTTGPNLPANFNGTVVGSLEYPLDAGPGGYLQARAIGLNGIAVSSTNTIRFQCNGMSNNLQAEAIMPNMADYYASPKLVQANCEQCTRGFVGNGSSTKYPNLTQFAAGTNSIINTNQIYGRGVDEENTTSSTGSDTAAQKLALRLASVTQFLMAFDWRNTLRDDWDNQDQNTMGVYPPLGMMAPLASQVPAHPILPYNLNGNLFNTNPTPCYSDGALHGIKDLIITDASNGGTGTDPNSNTNCVLGNEWQMVMVSHVTAGVPDQIALIPGSWMAVIVNATNAAITVPCGGAHYLKQAYDHSFVPTDQTALGQDVLHAGANELTGTGAITFASLFTETAFTCGTTPIPANSTIWLKVG